MHPNIRPEENSNDEQYKIIFMEIWERDKVHIATVRHKIVKITNKAIDSIDTS